MQRRQWILAGLAAGYGAAAQGAAVTVFYDVKAASEIGAPPDQGKAPGERFPLVRGVMVFELLNKSGEELRGARLVLMDRMLAGSERHSMALELGRGERKVIRQTVVAPKEDWEAWRAGTRLVALVVVPGGPKGNRTLPVTMMRMSLGEGQ